MIRIRKPIVSLLAIVLPIALMVLGVILSIVSIEQSSKEDCFNKIEENAVQGAEMFTHSMMQNHDRLALFANILAANSTNPDELLQTYMENFCNTNSFSSVCVHRRDGRVSFYGMHPHRDVPPEDFAEEVARTPYISDRLSMGSHRNEQYVYLAVPVVRDGEAVAVLYGFIALDKFPAFLSAAGYGGKCQFFLVDGKTGDFLLNEHLHYGDGNREIPLGNLYEDAFGLTDSREAFGIDALRRGVSAGKSGYHIFKSLEDDAWNYTYYMPLGINSWSLLLTIGEEPAFSTYYHVRTTVFTLILYVVVLALIVIAIQIYRSRRRRAQDAAELHKADYLNAVQSALITAHTNPDFVDQALKIMAKEMEAETVLLLTFDNKRISTAYFWPSEDRLRALALVGMHIQEVFPGLFDALASGESVVCDEKALSAAVSAEGMQIFSAFEVRSLMLVPIADTVGMLKGAIAAINLRDVARSPELLEGVTRDFFMAIANLENHNIIKKMGAIDYLTGVKNRNSFETEVAGYETIHAESLWCAYVDVNGLHELNNSQGHKAGDALLCAVADAVKKVFGPEFSYRLGGDEFLAFRANSSHEELMSFKYRLLDELGRKGYSVSVGFQGTGRNENNIFDVQKLMADAEAIMYQEKWRYYQETGLSTQRANPVGKPQ